jgi:3-deoxy-manno-octulosonate cytidylyltransferase (CMP-KDO synthetase)
MIERVYTQAKKARLVDRVLVATDDRRIYSAVQGFGGEVVMTRNDHPTGTDRLAEVASNFAEFEIVVNVQGDEPLIAPQTIDAAIRPLLDDSSLDMSTISARIKDKAEINNNTIVKVVSDSKGRALYFSRLPIPYYRENDDLAGQAHFGHIGLYAYRRDTLLKLSRLEPTPLEKAEALEQLRALENGICIRVVEVEKRSPAVDRPEDIKAVLDALNEFSASEESGFVPPVSAPTTQVLTP